MKLKPDKILRAAADLTDGNPAFFEVPLDNELRTAIVAAADADPDVDVGPPPALGAPKKPTAPQHVLSFTIDYKDGQQDWLDIGVTPQLAKLVSKATGF